MESVLIDTDVILDFLFDREPFSESATEILSQCENLELKGFVTPVIVSNVYYILRKVARHEDVIQKLSQLLLIIDVLEMDRSVILEALNSDFKDFEDALQNFSALKRGDISTILTRNTKDYQKSSLVILTPEEYLRS